jgi:DNA-directed RNA polymerase subunit RPC12/RpoP
MEFVAAKCPNCGGVLRLPDDKEQVKCMYCSFDIIVRKAVKVAGVNVNNLLKLASDGEETGNYEEAYKYFTQVLEYEPENYIALLGKGVAAAHLSRPDNFREEELIKGVEEALINAPEGKKEELKVSIAWKINSACRGKDNDSDYDRKDKIRCLEIAHDFDPRNIFVLYTIKTHCIYLDSDEYKKMSEECALKIDILNPEAAAKKKAKSEGFALYLKNKELETKEPLQEQPDEGGLLGTLKRFFGPKPFKIKIDPSNPRCPYCKERLRTHLAKQCPKCFKNWH